RWWVRREQVPASALVHPVPETWRRARATRMRPVIPSSQRALAERSRYGEPRCLRGAMPHHPVPVVDPGGAKSPCLRLLLLQSLDELWHNREQVAHDPEVSDVEDWRVAVLVDRDDGLRGLHPGEVLDRARDAQRDVELGGDRNASLPHLEIVVGVPRVHRDSGGTHRGPDLIGELLNELEPVLRADAAAA